MDPAIPSPSLPLSQSLSSFSLSSNSPLDPTITPTLPCPSLLDDRHPPRRYSPFERLPPELIELIAYSLCRSTNNNLGPPSGLVHLLLVSKRFERVLSFKRNKGFYAGLFKQRFDVESVERRWNIMRNIEEKREKLHLLQTLGGDTNKPSEGIHLNPSSSFTRPSSPSHSHSLDLDHDHDHDDGQYDQDEKWAPLIDSPWCTPLTNRDFAFELKRRCQVLTKMKNSVKQGGFFDRDRGGGGGIGIGTSRPASPRTTSFTPRRGTSQLLEPDELTQSLWTTYLMLLENDGKNLNHLIEYAGLREYMRLFYRHSLLAEALSPGWPRQTVGRALGLWISWLAGDDLASETAEESEEKFFVLKPYVFAAQKFDAFMAPWTIPCLPVSHEAYPVLPPPSGPYLADLRPRSHAQTITHMGRKLSLSPPNLSHAAIFSFFFRVEQDPTVQDDLLVHGTGTPAALQPHHQSVLPPPLPLSTNPLNHPQVVPNPLSLGGLTAHSRPTKTSLPTLSSRIHDLDFIRLASCIDPYTSLGLPNLYTKGSLQGNWEGRFSFFDFDSYRDMLGGRMRSLYEGPFGDQPQVWKLEERVVKLEQLEQGGVGGKARRKGAGGGGGKGDVLNAGFERGEQVPNPVQSRPSLFQPTTISSLTRSTSPPPVGSTRRRRTSTSSNTAAAGGGGIESVIMDDDEDDLDQGFTGGGGGGGGVQERATKRMRKRSEVAFWEDFDEVDEEGRTRGQELEDGDYEILLTGSGHSAWGQFNLKGRVRAWDGMFTIIKEYTPDSRGRWIYRGYRIGDSLVGRWRDTHTPVDMSGYEGTWSMNRRS